VNYYPFHIGDYATHTAHLEPMEDLAYRRLLDLYYLREGPLPADVQEVARLIRMRGDADMVERILNEFFQLFAAGWIHERCDAELSRMIERQTKAKASAEASVNARRANAQRSLNERSTTVELPTPTPTPVSSSTKKIVVQRPTDVSAEVWLSFLTVRKAKKAPVTDLAILGIRREAVKANIPLEHALTICCERGWAGFKAEWFTKDQANSKPAESFYERDLRLKRESWEEMTGRKWPTENDPNVIDATTTTLEIPQ
jgi:uncharacterized protein YdaU (DUF1376 family)